MQNIDKIYINEGDQIIFHENFDFEVEILMKNETSLFFGIDCGGEVAINYNGSWYTDLTAIINPCGWVDEYATEAASMAAVYPLPYEIIEVLDWFHLFDEVEPIHLNTLSLNPINYVSSLAKRGYDISYM